MKFKLLLLFCCFLFLGFQVTGQDNGLSNLRTKVISWDANQTIYFLDSLTVIPSSVSLKEYPEGQIIEKSHFQILKNQLHLKDSVFYNQQKISTYTVTYRVLPYDLQKSFSRLDTTKIGSQSNKDYIGFTINPYKEDEEIIKFKGLDYKGSFARGISFGNSQNLVLNSSFNLQLAGDLGDDIEILAAITDNNIPLQPEGNTQQLQEFDKIFIQLRKKENVLIAGDYELGRPNSYFMNYYKKLQGATFQNTSNPFKDAVLNTRASLAVARGEFARNLLPTEEGNQGPYRLMGDQGEQFIIALAGTEKIYFDGKLLTRGLEEDYVIDYNRADVVFTNKVLITKDSRIIVEFEYADQLYLRSLYAFDTELKYKKLRVHLNVFSEQDSRNSSGLQELDSLKQDLLAAVGDNLESALAPSKRLAEEFNEFRIQYELVDTQVVINNSLVNFEILVFSTNPDSANYTATFTEVGFGLGNYLLDPNTTQNGRVFSWIAPDANGNPLGNFEPVVQLIAPTQRQMFTAGADYEINKNGRIQTEVALSRKDLNRFSDIGDQDDVGVAAFTSFQQLFPLKKKWSIGTKADYEFTQSRFQALNPFRKAEFTRDWNLANNSNQLLDITKQDEHIARAEVSLLKNDLGSLTYQFSSFLRGSIYNGQKHFTQLKVNRDNWKIDTQLNFLEVDADREDSRFFRPKIDISKTLPKLGGITLGAYGEQERNERFSGGVDTLNAVSFLYNEYRVYLTTPEARRFTFGTNFTQRYDYAPTLKGFVENTVGDEFNVNGSWTEGNVSRLGWNFTYRKLSISDESLTNQTAQNATLGRLDHRLSLWKGVVRSTTNYEIGSGQEPRVAFNYLPVNAGDGVFFWDETLDFNGDGVPQVNEIREEAFPGEGNIIRITIFTNDFIRTNNITFNESFQTNFKRLFRGKKGFKKFLGKFSTQSTFRVVRRSREADGVSPFNPFQNNIPDTSLVAINSNVRNILFFNRGDQKYDFQIGLTRAWNKIVLTSGFQARQNDEQFFRSRWNISKSVSTQFEVATGLNLSDSEFFENQDFSINFFRIRPELTLQPSNSFRTILSYEFRESNNESLLQEQAIKHDFSFETTFNQNTATSIRSQLSYVKVRFDGERNTPLEFAILETLKDGQNFLWSLSLDRRLSKNILMSFSYEGRKTGVANAVHIGRAQVRATF